MKLSSKVCNVRTYAVITGNELKVHMSGPKLKKKGLTDSTQDPNINQASSPKTNVLLSVGRKKDHIPRTINSVYTKANDLLKDNHLKGSTSGQMSEKPLLGNSENVLRLEVRPDIDWGCDQTSGTSAAQGNDNRGSSAASPTCHRQRKRKMEMVVMSDPYEDLYSIDSQTSDEMSKGEQKNGSLQHQIPNARLLDACGKVSVPVTKQVKTCSTKAPIDEQEQKNRDMVFRPASPDQNNIIEMSQFDSEHSDSSLDNYDDEDDFNWNPQREFMKFLWDNLDDQDQKKNAEVSAHIVKKQRASVDTGTDCSNNQNGQIDHTNEISIKPQGKDLEISQAAGSRQYYKEHVEGIQKFLYGKSERTEQTSIGCGPTGLKEQLLGSGSNVKPLFYPCTNCNIVCKERSHLHRHMKQHGEPVNQGQILALICRECGWSFPNSAALLQHRSVHKERRHRVIEEMKKLNNLKDTGRNAGLQHALCLYSTNDPNTFAQHAKIYEKGKRNYGLGQSDLKAVPEFEHRSHLLATHNVNKPQTLNVEPETLKVMCPKALNSASNTLSLASSQNQNDVVISCTFKNSEIIEHSNGLPLPGQYSLSTSPSPFQELEKSLLNGKGGPVILERMPGSFGKEKPLQNPEKDLGSSLHKSVNTVLCQSTNEEASHDHRSYAQEEGTILSKECENSEKKNKDDFPHTSWETFQHPLVNVTMSTHQKQVDTKEIVNTNGKNFNIKQPIRNDSPSKIRTALLHDTEILDGPSHLPGPQQSLQKEEMENLSLKESQNPTAENLKTNCNVGEDFGSSNSPVGLRDVSVFEKDCDGKNEMEPQKCLDEGNKKGCDASVSSSELLLKIESPSEGSPDCQAPSQQNCPHTEEKEAPGGPEETPEQVDQVRTESQAELACPLCGAKFDTRTGLSNHVRGHLKRLGKAYSTAAIRSPLDILKQLMSNKEEFHKTVRSFSKRQIASKTCRMKEPFFVSIASITEDAWNSCEGLAGDGAKTKPFESTDSEKCSPSSDLIGMLKKRKAHDVKDPSHTTRKAFAVTLPPTDSLSEKNNFNRKVCVHCNATFHSGISLSNHLRAYERRKRAGLLDGTTYDCKQRKHRSGSKKKIFPLPYTTEEMYRLTCRFCDLVFQGPLSVQEDWIKHLQRHIMNTSVPRTGACMVEVTSLPIDSISEAKTEPSLFLTQVFT